MKKIALVLLIIATGFTAHLGFTTSKAGTDIQLRQLFQKAEACIEINEPWFGGLCCPRPDLWCYIGGGYEINPFYWVPPW